MKPTLESFEDTFASGCMEPVELASANGEDPTAEALVLPPLALDSHIEPGTGTAHTSENQNLVTTDDVGHVTFGGALGEE